MRVGRALLEAGCFGWTTYAAATWLRYGRSHRTAALGRDPLDSFIPDSEIDEKHETHVAEPAADLSVPALARVASMSERHFQRVFPAQVGTPRRRYVERAGVETARRLREAAETSVDAVARAAGFGTTETMRRAFHRQVGVARSDYRERFALTAVDGGPA